jgi:hypothetical protein
MTKTLRFVNAQIKEHGIYVVANKIGVQHSTLTRYCAGMRVYGPVEEKIEAYVARGGKAGSGSKKIAKPAKVPAKKSAKKVAKSKKVAAKPAKVKAAPKPKKASKPRAKKAPKGANGAVVESTPPPADASPSAEAAAVQ